jgi:hypothetical protein
LKDEPVRRANVVEACLGQLTYDAIRRRCGHDLAEQAHVIGGVDERLHRAIILNPRWETVSRYL